MNLKESMKSEIKKFKDHMIDIMTTAFEIEGQFITTVFFLYQNEELLITPIPGALMATNHGKDSLVGLIKEKCKDPLIKAAAIIMVQKPDNLTTFRRSKLTTSELVF